MKKLWFRFAAWVRWWWTLSDRFHSLTAAYEWQGRRLAGTEDALKRVARSLEDEIDEECIPPMRPGEMVRIAQLQEKCGELMMAAAKVLQHGRESCSPFSGKPNYVTLERAAGQLKRAIDSMVANGDLRKGDVAEWRRRKAAAVPSVVSYVDEGGQEC